MSLIKLDLVLTDGELELLIQLLKDEISKSEQYRIDVLERIKAEIERNRQ